MSTLDISGQQTITNAAPTSVEDAGAIAIIGLSGRFPRARNVREFWNNLRDGVEAISLFTAEELAEAGTNPAALQHPGFVNAGAVLEDVEMFDAAFFGYTPREAEVLDPQQRIMLECAWHALEDAGYDPYRFDRPIGCFAGAALSTYLFNLIANEQIMQLVGPLQIIIGNDKDHVSTRISYKLNLKGPSVTVQTACSTSLVAVHTACQSLLNHQCDMAIAGGVGLRFPQKSGYLYQEGGISSPDGHCRPFDASAKGTVTGNGAGLVVLKRLSEALSEGDRIRAVIRGIAINNDGSGKVGYTAPSVEGEAEVIAMAQMLAGVDPDSINYIEAHGTATPLGDPIEIAALTKAFRLGTARRNFCGIGSVKSNIGHLDPAAGIAGLIKTVLMLENQELPPSLHFTRPNPELRLEESPFYVVKERTVWPRGTTPRRAGVSSFGIGGTNAHAVLEEAPPAQPSSPARSEQLLLISAKTASALDRLTADVGLHLKEMSADPATAVTALADLAWTSQAGRAGLQHRRLCVCTNIAEARVAFADANRDRLLSSVANRERTVAFMFPGQGTQHPGMARELYQSEPTFEREFDRCAAVFHAQLGINLKDLIFGSNADDGTAAGRLQMTGTAQPALFCIEYALARLWMEWGVQPAAMIGHSIGEYVAAALAGVFAVEDACVVVAERARLMQQLPGGAMLSVQMSEVGMHRWLNEHDGNGHAAAISIAAVNAPLLCTISGSGHAMDEVEQKLQREQIGCRRLHTSHAFHSAVMDDIAGPFRDVVGRVPRQDPEIPFISNLTGTWAVDVREPDYWVRHLRHTVRFADGINQLLQKPDCVLLEVGPGEALGTLARQCAGSSNGDARREPPLILSSLCHPNSQRSTSRHFCETLGRAWLAGVKVDWHGYHRHERRRRVPYPQYAFERQRYWIGGNPAATGTKAAPTPPAPHVSSQPVSPSHVEDMLYLPTWTSAQLQSGDTARLTDPVDAARVAWLVVGPPAVSAALAQRLRDAGRRAVTISPTRRFARLDPDTYEVDAQREEDYRAAVVDLLGSGCPVSHVVHVGDPFPETAAPGADIAKATQAAEGAISRGFNSLVYLARALAAHVASKPLQLGIVTVRAHSVLPADEVNAPAAATHALSRVIPQEYPTLRCRCFDLSALDVSAARAGALDWLLAELQQETVEPLVAERQGQRWVLRYRRAELPAPAMLPARLRHAGTYLISGGFGNIGLALAGELLRSARANVVLLGRQLPRGEKERRVQELEGLGGRVLSAAADVSDVNALGDAVRQVRARFGDIHGVIHAAGTTTRDAFPMLAQCTPELTARHFRPKVLGLWALEQAVRSQQSAQPDFWLLFSSLSVVLGGLGFGPYAAANAWMDAESARRNQGTRPCWITVNWDGWDFSTGSPQAGGGKESRMLRPAEGVEACRRILNGRQVGQVIVSATPLQQRMDQWVLFRGDARTTARDGASAAAVTHDVAARAHDGGAATLASHPRPDMAIAYAAPRNTAEQLVAAIWQEMLGLDRVGINDNFFDLGGHSLLAVQIVARLRASFNVDLPVGVVFDAPTIAQVAGLLGSGAAAGHPPQAAVSASAGDAAESGELTELLDLVENLSADQISAMLGEEKANREVEGSK